MVNLELDRGGGGEKVCELAIFPSKFFFFLDLNGDIGGLVPTSLPLDLLL